VESKLGPLGTSATEWPIYDDGEFGGMKIGRGNRSTRRKPAPAPLCPPQITLDQTRVWTRAAAAWSQRLTAWAMARPCNKIAFIADIFQTLNTPNKSMQRKNENILAYTDKINSFKEELILWGARIEKRTKLKCSRWQNFANWTKILSN
jgi:hypothetical protein